MHKGAIFVAGLCIGAVVVQQLNNRAPVVPAKADDIKFLDTNYLDAAYFPVSRFQGLPGIYRTYGNLQAYGEMCGFAIPDNVKNFVDKDMQMFPPEVQSQQIKATQGARGFTKERFADLLKYNNITEVCSRENIMYNYELKEFPENEVDNVLKMLGEWIAVSNICGVGDAGLTPIFEKAHKLGISLNDIDKYRKRYDYWRDVALERMGASDKPADHGYRSASMAGRICASASLTFQVLNNE